MRFPPQEGPPLRSLSQDPPRLEDEELEAKHPSHMLSRDGGGGWRVAVCRRQRATIFLPPASLAPYPSVFRPSLLFIFIFTLSCSRSRSMSVLYLRGETRNLLATCIGIGKGKDGSGFIIFFCSESGATKAKRIGPGRSLLLLSSSSSSSSSLFFPFPILYFSRDWLEVSDRRNRHV